MRRVPSLDFPLGTAFRKPLASVLSLAIFLGPASAFAYDDDRYTYTPPRVQGYQTQYKPQNNVSPSFQLDRQISNQNAAMQLRFGTRQGFAPTTFSLSSINQPSLPQPKFQFAELSRTSLPEFKINLPKPQAATKPEPKGFFGTIGAGVKAVGNAFKGFVQAVGNAIAKAFTIDRTKITYEARRDQILKTNPEIKEIGHGTFQVSDGKQFQHGGTTWEPGSTFQMNDDGRGIRLTQGVTMSPDLGGIKRADGKPLPVVMTLENDRFTPTGIDYSRIEPKTKFDYTHPVTVNGLGTIPAGASMTYEGTKPGTKADPTPVIMLSFQNARIENPGKALESITSLKNEKITLTQMEVRLKGRINEINGLHINRGNEKLFVSQYGETFSVTQLEQKTAKAQQASASLTQQSRKRTADVNSSVTHSNKLTKDLHAHTGTPSTLDFQTKAPVVEQAALAKLIEQKTNELAAHMANGEYSQVANTISELESAQSQLQGEIKNQQAQVDSFQQYKRSLKGLEQAYGRMVENNADVRTIQTKVVTPEQIRDAAPYFQKEKNAVRIQTTNALKALDAMESAGVITTAENALKSAEIILMSRHLLAAKPDVTGNKIIATAASIEESYQSTSRDFDDAIFKHFYNMADRYPRTMQTLGQGVLAVAGGAAVVGLIYSAINAPATTLVAVEAGIISQKTFEAMGVSPEAAAACAAVVSAPLLAWTSASASFRAMDKSGAGLLRSAYNYLKGIFKYESPVLTEIANSEAGHIYVGGFKKQPTIVPLGSSANKLTQSTLSKKIPFSSPQEASIGWREYQRSFNSKDLMVIGQKTDALIAETWPDHQILDIPKHEWTDFVNDAWIQGGIDRRATFYLGSPQNQSTLNRPWGDSVFARELKQLYNAGYKKIGDLLIPPSL